MIGHDSGKTGHWYEEGYVVLQLLRLLNHELASVTWELEHEDGEGIDCLLVEGGASIAVQCKTRSTGQWTLRRLEREGVLDYAYERLTTDPDLRFRFVTDAGCQQWQEFCERACATDSPEEWWETTDAKAREILARAWQLPEGPGRPQAAHDLACRIEVELLGEKGVKQHSRSLASALSGEPERLLEVLRQLARSSLTRELREVEVRRELRNKGVTLRLRSGGPRIHDRLEALAGGFLERVEASRGPLAPIDRREADTIVEAVTAKEPRTVLVHGPAGCGKTEVIAAALRQLREIRPAIPVLVLAPDLEVDGIGLGADPVGALRLYAAGRRSVLVIDQLDQVLLAGERSQKLLRRCHGWLRRARELDVAVIVGARTAEAEADTQLWKLLGERAARIFVEDLDEAEAAEILAKEGIASFGQEASLRRLIRRPLALRLAIQIHREGGALDGLRSMVSIVERWLDTVAKRFPDCDAPRAVDALDEVLGRLERDGVMSVASDGFRDPAAIDALVQAGVLIRENDVGIPRVRLFHQILADVRIARQWAEAGTVDELLKRLGTREAQSLHQARRLRLAAPLFLERPGGVALVRSIVASEKVRPILKQAVFLALAAMEAPPADLLKTVESWLAEPPFRRRVLSTLVRGQREWIQTLSESGWLDRAWQAEDPPVPREELMDLLASVSVHWGDGVADRLKRWKESFPETLDLAHRVFLQAPGNDSDALFEMRLEYVARGVEEDPYWDWETLLRRVPERGVRLLEVLLTQGDPDVLTRDGPIWSARFPTSTELPPEVARLGKAIWDRLRAWWCGVQLRDGLLLLPSAHGELGEGFLPKIVALLAAGLAHELTRRPEALDDLLREMPTPLRELDGWLLLCTGARLPEHATEAAGGLARWFMSEPRWARIRVGLAGSAEPVKRFVKALGVAVSDETFREFEEWLLDYRDPWTRKDEERRTGWQQRFSMGVPSDTGSTAHLLLPLLPPMRLSLRSERRLGELRRKFGESRSEEGSSRGGLVRSKVPDEIAARWNAEEWLRRLRDPELPPRWTPPSEWRQMGPNSIGVYSLSQLVAQLRHLAGLDPRRYLPLALQLEPSDHWEVRAALLEALCRRRPPSGGPDGRSWAPLSDEEVAELVMRPGYLDEPAADRLMARVVEERPHYPWPEEVRKRLARMATGEVLPGIPKDERLALYRLNETGCMALDAIAGLARHHEDLRAWALEIAEGLAHHSDPGRRAGAAGIAAACLNGANRCAVEVLLKAAENPLVTAEHDVVGALFRMVVDPGSKDEAARDQTLSLLLAMTSDSNDRVAHIGGQVAAWLRHRGAIGDLQLHQALERGIAVRRGIAAVVQGLLIEQNPQQWLRELAVELAADPDPQTGDTILYAFLEPSTARLLAERGFMKRLITAATGAGHDMGPLVEACDREAHLQPLAEIILHTAENLTTEGRTRFGRGDADDLMGLLARLVEEAERDGDFALRTRALDAWDGLLDRDLPPASRAIATRMDLP